MGPSTEIIKKKIRLLTQLYTETETNLKRA